MNGATKLFYQFTAYYPRRLPETPEQYDCLKNVILNAYGLPDEPATWITVAGHIKSTPATKLRKSWGAIANAAKRLKINALAQENSMIASQAHHEDLQKKMADVAQAMAEEERTKNAQDTAEGIAKEDATQAAQESSPAKKKVRVSKQA